MKIRREAKLALTALAAVFILIWGINFLKGSSLFEVGGQAVLGRQTK